MRRHLARFIPVLLVVPLSLAACEGSEPREPQLFDRYVAMGGSTAAGWRSGGIVGSSQAQAYPELLAAQAQAGFVSPLVAEPGCPAPLTEPLGTAAPATACALADGVRGPVQNVAVPGTRLADALAAPASPGTLQELLIGMRSQVEAMQRARPTFVSVQLGDDDVLEAALEGNATDELLTPLADFQASLDALAAELDAVETLQGAILVGVTDPVTTIPLLQPGAYYFLARDVSTGNFQGKPVNANCSPVTALGQPNPLAANLVSMRILSDATVPEINCDPAIDGRRHLLDAVAQALVRARVAQYNAAIQALAASRGWSYLDPNAVLGPQLALQTSGRYDSVRKCQLLATAATAAQFQAAVLNSCPVTGPTAAPGSFGSLVSYDGVSPTAAAQLLLAQAMRDPINLRHGPIVPW